MEAKERNNNCNIKIYVDQQVILNVETGLRPVSTT